MLPQSDTKLEVFHFGEQPEDHYYCLVNLKVSPEGLSLDRIRLADPRNFDRVLTESGCITFLNGEEIHELARRGELDREDLHTGVYELCIREGLIT